MACRASKPGESTAPQMRLAPVRVHVPQCDTGRPRTRPKPIVAMSVSRLSSARPRRLPSDTSMQKRPWIAGRPSRAGRLAGMAFDPPLRARSARPPGDGVDHLKSRPGCGAADGLLMCVRASLPRLRRAAGYCASQRFFPDQPDRQQFPRFVAIRPHGEFRLPSSSHAHAGPFHQSTSSRWKIVCAWSSGCIAPAGSGG